MNYYYVYVLQSEMDGLFYIGFSRDVHQRLTEHNAGKNVSTKHRKPFKLIFFEAYLYKSDALRREAYFKTAKGKTTLKMMVKDYMSKQNSQKII